MRKEVTWRYPWVDPATLPKDPPLPEPYPGYSMMESVKLEQQAAIEKAARAYAAHKNSRRKLKNKRTL